MSRRKSRDRKFAFLLLVVLLLVMLVSYALAQESVPGMAVTAVDAPGAKIDSSSLAKGLSEHWQVMRDGAAPRDNGAFYASAITRVPVATTAFEPYSLSGATACSNLIANSQLNILEFGDGTGTADPWVFLEPIVYYVNENDPADPYGPWAFDGYSLVFEDGDAGDPSPTIDMFAQGFLMPGNLTEVTVEYWRASVDGNPNDVVWGELWLLDDEGYLHWDDPDTYFVGYWDVYESEGEWNLETITTPDEIVKDLDGRWAALGLYNDTDGSSPSAPENEKEWMLIDDITLTACYKPTTVSGKKAYLPSVQRAGETAPFCMPPSENPRDEYHSNRGSTQTGATCNSSLSNVDKADYYTFKPEKSGSHTLQLKKLPKDTEWSAMIFTDTSSPEYAPGETGGQCRIDTPGSKDKNVKCELSKDKAYFIKVSAGSTPKAGNYEMKVVK